MSLGRDPPFPATVSSLEDAVRKAFTTSAEAALESLETEGLLGREPLRTEAARTTLGFSFVFLSAALETTTKPPSILLQSASPGERIVEVSDDNCPCVLRDFISVWTQTVPTIRRLLPEELNTVRRLLCGLALPPALRDPHLEGVASALDAVASAFSTWCMRRDPVVSSQGSVRVRSTAPLEHASAVSEHPSHSMPRKRGERAGDSARTTVLTTKGRKGSSRKNPIIPQSSSVDEGPRRGRLRAPTSTTTGFEQKMGGRAQVEWGPIVYSDRRSHVLPPLPPGKRPTIWAASRNELCALLPELGQAQDNIIFEGTETPILFIDGPCGKLDKWEGGKTISLSMTRTFKYAVACTFIDLLCGHNTPTQPMTAESPPRPHQTAPIPYPSEAVLNEEGLYVFPHEPDGELATQPPQAPQYSSAVYGASTALGDVYIPAIEDAPTEIHALIRAQQSRIPFNVILCRGASLSAFALPDGCGCAYLGFFFITDVVASKSSCSWGEDAEGPFVQGAVTWSFELNWTPGGDDPDALTAPSKLPWWMEDPSGPSTQGADPGPSEDITMHDNMDISVQHPYILLPLHFFAPPSQTGGGATGWRCTSCGRLNIQRNLCVQRCGSCSTSNGLAPLAIEDVRQFRGTDPITYPWNSHGEDVELSLSDGPEELRRFTYKITDGTFVHHLFTRNHTTVQAQPTKLFHDLQAEVELEAEPVVKVARGAPSLSYGAQFGNASQVDKHSSGWPSDVPTCISRARDLMLRRARLNDDSSDIAISSLTVSSWRNPGNKKGLAFAAAQSPVVVLCLGANVELTFTPSPQAVARRTPAPKRKAAQPTPAANEDEIDEDAVTDIEHSKRPSSRSTAKKSANGARRERPDAPLIIALVHGDLLVVQGAVLEYSLKKTGMSILLFGSQ